MSVRAWAFVGLRADMASWHKGIKSNGRKDLRQTNSTRQKKKGGQQFDANCFLAALQLLMWGKNISS
jgi:hypothetical protein